MKRKMILLAWLGFILFSNAQTGKRTFNTGEVFRDCAECPEMVALPSGNSLWAVQKKN